MADCYWQWPFIWWRQCHCQSHNCGQSPFRLFIGVAIRDIRYRTQWRISIFSFTCHRLLRAVPMLYFSQILYSPVAQKNSMDTFARSASFCNCKSILFEIAVIEIYGHINPTVLPSMKSEAIPCPEKYSQPLLW